MRRRTYIVRRYIPFNLSSALNAQSEGGGSDEFYLNSRAYNTYRVSVFYDP